MRAVAPHGLSAAWPLQKKGFTDVILLEMNDQAGGNSRWEQNEITAYPWAAHYAPVPGPKAFYLRELFEELGVLKNGQWEERYLCFAPQERLFLYGRWQEGIETAIGPSQTDRDQLLRLEEQVHSFRATGELTVPMDVGFSDSTAHLDQISFVDWLRDQCMDSRILICTRIIVAVTTTVRPQIKPQHPTTAPAANTTALVQIPLS